MQFYTGDWKKDPALSQCLPATRGIWIDACAAMHDFRTGSLSGTPDQLARLLRCSSADVLAANVDLLATGTADVTERNGVITWTCRRLDRESKTRDSNNKRQKSHRERQCITVPSQNSNSPPSYSVPIAEPKGTVPIQVAVPRIADSAPAGANQNRFFEMQTRITKLFRATRHWSCFEESTLAEISRRATALQELEAIIEYRDKLSPKDKMKFPLSVRTLLDRWDEMLDRAHFNPGATGTGNGKLDRMMRDIEKL